MAEKTTRIAVLLDGDNTTWSENAAIIEVPRAEMDALIFEDGKSCRRYLPGKNAKDAVECIERIVEILYPNGDLEAHWAVDTIEDIARAIKDSGFEPEEEEDR